MFGKKKKRIEVLETKVRFLEDRLEFQGKMNLEFSERLNEYSRLKSMVDNHERDIKEQLEVNQKFEKRIEELKASVKSMGRLCKSDSFDYSCRI